MRLKSWNKKNKGFTLIELIAVLAIMGIIGTLILQLTVTSSKSYIDISEQINGRRDANMVLAYITNEIRQQDKAISSSRQSAMGIESGDHSIIQVKGQFEIYIDKDTEKTFNRQWVFVRDNNCFLQYGNVSDGFGHIDNFEEQLTFESQIQSIVASSIEKINSDDEKVKKMNITVHYDIDGVHKDETTTITVRSDL